jgi:hypothetical protein
MTFGKATYRMKRRDFLTALASAIAASGYLPLLTQAQKQAREVPRPARQMRNIFTRPPAIEPITGFLPSFQGVSDGSVDSGEYELTYTAVIWAGVDSKTNRTQTREGGSLVLRRRQGGSRSLYTVDQKRQHGRRINHLYADCISAGLNDALMEWKVTSRFLEAKTGNEIPELTLAEKGTVQGNVIRLNDGCTDAEFLATGPLLSQWNVLGMLAKGAFEKTPVRFELMHELSVFKPGQMLKYTGEVQVPLATGDVNLHCYAQTGYGVLPTHYLVDRAGRVQLITQSMLNWALQKVT